MAINTIQGFNPSTTEPIDSRVTVANETARLAFATFNVYEGLVVYQEDTDELYVLNDAANPDQTSSWSTVGGGSGFPFTGSASISGSLDVDGNVGIGTTPTEGRLHVKGEGSNSATTALLVQNASGADLLKVVNDGTLKLAGNKSIRFFGLQAFEGSNQDGNHIRIAENSFWDSTRINSPTIITGNNDAPDASAMLQVDSTFIVRDDGNVGIGTTTPTGSLQLLTSSTTTLRVDTTNSFGRGLKIETDGLNQNLTSDGGTFSIIGKYYPIWEMATQVVIPQQYFYGGGVNFRKRGTTDNLIEINLEDSASPRMLLKGSGTTSTTTALRVENSNATASLVVRDDGNVGIGTTSPTAKTHIVGDSTSSTDTSLLVENSANTDLLKVDNSGTITVAPYKQLQTSSGNAITIQGPTHQQFKAWTLGFRWLTQNGTIMELTNDGKLGIGTTSPSEKLTIEGNISASGDLAIQGFPSVSASLASSGGGGSAFPFTGSAQIQGLGITSATSALKIENANPSTIFDLKDNGQFSVGPSNNSISIASNGRVTIAASAPDLSIGGGNYLDFPGGAGTIDGVRTINRTGEIRVNATQGTRFGNTSLSTGTRVSIVGDSDTTPFGIRQTPGGTTNKVLATFVSGSGDVVMGITADGGFTATDSTLVKRYVFEHGYSPSPADGMGIGLDLKTENASGGVVSVGHIDVIQDDISEDESSLRFSVGETTPTEVMRLQSDGNVGIGTTTPYATLTVAGNITQTENSHLISTRKIAARNASGLALYNDGGQGIDIKDNNDVIITSGNVGIGATSPSEKLDVDGTVKATAFVETSARKFKENIEPISSALETVIQLQGVTFNRIGEQKVEHGFIADEVKEVIPELVSHDANGEVHGVHYARTVAVLTEAIKELDNKVKAQDLFIKDLVARIEKLENK